MRDTFLTIGYKGFYIHSCYDNGVEKVSAQGTLNNGASMFFKEGFKSRRAAQIYITHVIKTGNEPRRGERAKPAKRVQP